ncbi:DUF2306 domain-containing protein [Parvularcula sp. IMCC14364]|uniref:DUF2306 domain-containing protein n=1 Tax=Parvularcula sp. IMCC14364 TaxID=3067902 RepID=UPI002740F33F|nr:DUF2306 domain-containing protein [Parvularcula sp. IMCC14364]
MNLEILQELPAVILLHLFAALAAFFLGGFQLLAPKGTVPHKTLGWIWFSLMIVVAVSAIFIRNFEGSALPTLFGFSPIHLFVVLTLWSVPSAIIAIKRGNVKAHASAVRGLYLGGMLIAGAFTFMPGRTMYQIFFG